MIFFVIFFHCVFRQSTELQRAAIQSISLIQSYSECTGTDEMKEVTKCKALA